MTGLVIQSQIYYDMINYCIARLPMEACGFLSGNHQVIRQIWPITNIENSPVSFTMAQQEKEAALAEIRSSNQELYAIFHSHPTAPAYPSPYDIRHAHLPCSYLIVSLAGPRPRARSFKISQGALYRESIVLMK